MLVTGFNDEDFVQEFVRLSGLSIERFSALNQAFTEAEIINRVEDLVGSENAKSFWVRQ